VSERRRARSLLLVGVLAFLLTGCGTASEGETAVEPDTLLAEALVPLHLADARAATTGEDADSLRARAYVEAERTTGLDSAAVAARLQRVVRHPEEATALYGRLAERLEALGR
jgi:hypothetical protein